MINNLNLLVNFIIDQMDSVVVLLFGGGIITIFFAIRLVKRVSRLLDNIH